MVWLVKLKDRATDIEELSRLLSAPEICIIQEGQDFFLKSTDFNSLKESGDVLKRANELIS